MSPTGEYLHNCPFDGDGPGECRACSVPSANQPFPATGDGTYNVNGPDHTDVACSSCPVGWATDGQEPFVQEKPPESGSSEAPFDGHEPFGQENLPGPGADLEASCADLEASSRSC